MRSEVEQLIRHWYRGAEEAWTTAAWLAKGRRNAECLFFCQLALEKLLKGLVVLATEEPAPYLHDLVRLATHAGIEASSTQKEEFAMITGFNLQARYDDEKTSFHKLATAAFTSRYLAVTSELRLWLQKKYPRECVDS